MIILPVAVGAFVLGFAVGRFIEMRRYLKYLLAQPDATEHMLRIIEGEK